MQNFMKKTTLILIGLAMIIGCTLLSPAMHEIALAYPDAPSTLFPLLITLPSLTLLAGLAVSAALSSKIAAKPLILLGLVLILAGGMLPAWMNSLPLIIVCRGVLGVGLGIIMPLQMALFAQYPERERATLIGYNSGINCIIGVFFFTAAGKLALSDWHDIFYLYAAFIPIVLLTMRYIPYEAPVPPAAHNTQQTAASSRLPGQLFLYCVFVAIAMLTFYVIVTNLALYLNDYQLGDATVVGLITAVGTAGSAIGGLLVSQITRLLKNYAAPCTMAVMAAGFLCLIQTQSVAAVGLGYILLAFSQGVFGCVIAFKITQIVALEQVSLATSCYMATVYISQFLAPYLMLGLQGLLGLGTMRSVFVVYAIAMVVATVLFILVTVRENRSSQKTLQG